MIQVENLTKSFGNNPVLKGVDLSVADGEIFVIIGPSGQGKSTLLRIIDTLEVPTSGDVRIKNESLYTHGDGNHHKMRRKIGMVFQNPAIFQGTVFDNVAYGLRYRKISSSEMHERVSQTLREVGLEGYEKRDAHSLSGGEKQRIAFARTMVTRPEIILLDEPTSNVDPITTEKIEEIIRYTRKTYNTTMIMNTHDMLQGQRMGDRIGVMMNGRIVQSGTPKEVFTLPANGDVARFIGYDNVFEGKIQRTDGRTAVIQSGNTNIYGETPLPAGTAVTWCIRTEDMHLHMKERLNGHTDKIRNHLRGRVKDIALVGPKNHVMADCGIPLEVVVGWRFADRVGVKTGDWVWVSFNPEAVHVMPR
ncbi:ABC transporter ATP-binding protein [Methanogenium organophilum]|uniref:Molybdate/tungstate import ATP-binding protein WtpC n=1 Tax=Methanogenium organophilum TaxID=2199 RepID=A0A9X9S5P7_METOG|nr:ABC transporter ATP-binding protein [Methanogenium organophilum]WAI01385.1 ABC transporter ATP-binding protein [Methanogenium organophilum]